MLKFQEICSPCSASNLHMSTFQQQLRTRATEGNLIAKYFFEINFPVKHCDQIWLRRPYGDWLLVAVCQIAGDMYV